MSGRREWFVNYRDLQIKTQVKVGNGATILAEGVGDILVQAFDGNKWDSCVLKEVLHVPELKFNLYSVSTAVDRGMKVASEQKRCVVTKGDSLVAVGEQNGNLYSMKFKVIAPEESSEENAYVHQRKKESLRVWHERLAHQNVTYVKRILKSSDVEVDTKEDFFCEACALGKMHRLPFPDSESKTKEAGELIHANVCGSMEAKSLGVASFFLLFKDDYSHYRTLYFLEHKSEVAQCLKDFLKKVQTQLGRGIKRLRTDNGLEFLNAAISGITTEFGIEHETSVVYTPEQNGSAERENRTLEESARTMMHSKGFDKSFWAEAVNSAAFVLNRTGTSSVPRKTPYELWFGRPASRIQSKIFGTTAYAHIPKQKRKKWDPKAKPGVFVGYGENTKGYRIWYPEREEVKILRDVVFANGKPGLAEKNREPEKEEETVRVIVDEVEDLPDEPDEDEEEPLDSDEPEEDGEERLDLLNEEEPEEIEPNVVIEPEARGRYGLRDRRTIRQPEHLADYVIEEELFLAESQEPKTYSDAVQSQEADEWRDAIDSEMDSLDKN